VVKERGQASVSQDLVGWNFGRPKLVMRNDGRHQPQAAMRSSPCGACVCLEGGRAASAATKHHDAGDTVITSQALSGKPNKKMMSITLIVQSCALRRYPNISGDLCLTRLGIFSMPSTFILQFITAKPLPASRD
jgi:hypothetical protein